MTNTVTRYDIPTWRDEPRTAAEIRDALAALNSVAVTVQQIEAAAKSYSAAAYADFDPDALGSYDADAGRRRGMQAMVDYATREGFDDPVLAADVLDYRHCIIVDCYANGYKNPKKEIPSVYYGSATWKLDPGAFSIWPGHMLWKELRLMGLCDNQIEALGASYNGDDRPAGYLYREEAGNA